MACALYLAPFSSPSPSPSPSTLPSQSQFRPWGFPSPSPSPSSCRRGVCLVSCSFPQSQSYPYSYSYSHNSQSRSQYSHNSNNSQSRSQYSHNSNNSQSRSKSQPRRFPNKSGPGNYGKSPPPRSPTKTNFPIITTPKPKDNKEKQQEDKERRRHWKAGEFPALSLSEIGSHGNINRNSSRNSSTSTINLRTPIKNIKKKLEQRENAKAWVCTVTEALSDSIRLKDCPRALHVFRLLREQPFYEPREGTYMKLFLLLGKSGHPDWAHQLFDEMLQEGLQPTPALYTALLAGYCRNNLIDEAFQVLQTMKTLPLCQPDVYTYSTLLKACVDAPRFDLVDAIYQEMAERSITPNTVTQNTVLSGYGKAGKFDEMERILAGMLENPNCKPDVWTMNIILSLFGNMGQLDSMEKWYEKFRNYGIEPETRTFNILIGAYGKKKLYDKMSAVMEYMRKLNVPWTSSTYNNIIEAFADVGDAKNMEHSFNQMRGEGMKPDTKTFCCLINGYSNAGLFPKVVSTIQFAEKNEVRANTAFHNAVMSACAKAGDLLEMERVFNRMKERGCAPDKETYTILIEAYRKEGMNDKIFDLEQSDLSHFAAVPS